MRPRTTADELGGQLPELPTFIGETTQKVPNPFRSDLEKAFRELAGLCEALDDETELVDSNAFAISTYKPYIKIRASAGTRGYQKAHREFMDDINTAIHKLTNILRDEKREKLRLEKQQDLPQIDEIANEVHDLLSDVRHATRRKKGVRRRGGIHGE
jgi:hypothetical protein